MNHSHLSDEEMIALLYGLRDQEHCVAGCAECQDRLEAMDKARLAMVVTAARRVVREDRRDDVVEEAAPLVVGDDEGRLGPER